MEGHISILVTGRAGSGKSSLVNGILGMNIEEEVAAKENDSNTLLKTCTTGRDNMHLYSSLQTS